MHIRTHPSYLHDDRGQQQPRVVPRDPRARGQMGVDRIRGGPSKPCGGGLLVDTSTLDLYTRPVFDRLLQVV